MVTVYVVSELFLRGFEFLLLLILVLVLDVVLVVIGVVVWRLLLLDSASLELTLVEETG